MAESDWDTVTFLRKKPMNAAAARSTKAVTSAQRKGEGVDTTKKFSAATNKQKTASKDTAKLDRETEELHHEKVSMDVGRVIMRVRSEMKMTQKELATKINEKPQIVNDYEAGRAIPNQQIMGKLERVLGVKLRGKDIGQPLAAKGGKK
ncbi:endothelial differentiation-related factor 1 homolog [Corticium candelabrum]|uniref:endothelial differentiation-related factor 1 homolog n=1 Tax=Corticium candelabrum TaxID=121492 RepID=UPI002E2648D0|nr:endothelial differentiation-related factor 1 homolog [Corticium candelabrum]